MSEKSRWVLPENVTPEDTICFQIEIPNDPAYLAAFRGAVYNLTVWNNWERDEEHKATQVAQQMWQAYVNIRECPTGGDMQLRLCQTGCGIEYSTDDGETWTCLDLSGCIENIWDEKLAQAFDDGFFSRGVTQQGPQPAPAGGTCYTYHAKLRPGEQWHSPSPVKSHSTIRVFNAKGGWSVGELAWWCPDGSRYLLGTCDAQLKTHDTGDLLNPGAYHMQIVALVGSTYYDPMSGTVTVPFGTEETDFFLMANTGMTGTPSGEVEFDVEVCEEGVWCVEYDFANGAQGWRPIHAAAGDYAFWQGDHWTGAYNYYGGNWTELYLTHDGTPGTHLLQIEYLVQFLSATGQDAWGWNHAVQLAVPGDTNVHWISGSLDKTGNDDFRMDMSIQNSGGNQILLKGIRLHGTGNNPFGDLPCSE